MSEPQVDLSKLALNRSPPETSSRKPRRRPWVSRYVVPAVILTGFLMLLAASAGQQLLPSASVRVVPVIVKRGEVQQAGTSLFQAPGWIEPRPTSVRVAALAPGVIESLLVVEGQQVSQGEPIAHLIAIDAELAVDQAKAQLAIRQGELQRVEAEHEAAVSRLEQPVHLQAKLAEAQSLWAKAKTEHEKLPYLIRSAEASVVFTRTSLQRKQTASDAIAQVVIALAAKDYAADQATLEELKQRGPNLKREIDALHEKVNAISKQLQLLIEERRQVAESKAKAVSAAALCDESRLRLRQAQLNLERTVIHAPINGRILRLVASPGTRVMGLETSGGQSSSTVVEMYDPKQLQVRADVRLEDVPLVTPGAAVEVDTASSETTIRGHVLQATSAANIQKNTLEVKVALVDPPPTIRPEMLVTANFLAPQLADEAVEPVETERLFVPEQLVQQSNDGPKIWIVDADNRAAIKSVVPGRSGPDGLVEIVKGLRLTDKLIASDVDSLTEGDRVSIGGEDQSIGIAR